MITEEVQQPKSEKPLLTIAIPTYNRARYLKENLAVLFDQLVAEPRVELIVSDNASPDETPEVVRNLVERGLQVRYLRNETNVGADANFLQCFELARGKYVWLVGDDDIILPGGIARTLALLAMEDYGLVYVTPYSFLKDFLAEKPLDTVELSAEVIPDGMQFVQKAGPLLMFISAMIVNKDYYATTTHHGLRDLVGTSLIQLGWVLPVLANSSRHLFVREKIVAQRLRNSGGWGVCKVFGINFLQILEAFLEDRREIATELRNAMLRSWLPHWVMGARSGTEGPVEAENMRELLEPRFKRFWRYWIYIFPLITLPLGLAGRWFSITRVSNRLRPGNLRRFLRARFSSAFSPTTVRPKLFSSK
jgi:abequosyltransferase